MLTGWKDITEYTSFSRNTVKRLAREENFPLQYIASKPTTTRKMIEKWIEERVKKTRRAH